MSLVWSIETAFDVLLNITYLELPFLGIGCPSARLIIIYMTNVALCGRRSHLAWHVTSKITVYLQQDITVPGSTGFVATYAAMVLPNMDALGIAYCMVQSDGQWLNTSLQLNGRYGVKPDFSWHVVVLFDKLIEFSIESSDNYQVYDGPGPLSPVLHNKKQSSAFHLYVVQHSPHLTLHYTSLLQTSFSSVQQVVLYSQPLRNTVYSYQVKGGNKAVRISFLSIHSNEILTDFPVKCLFGGFFVHDIRSVTLLDVCEADWKEEVLYHLTEEKLDDDDIYVLIFVILFGGYTDGKIAISVESSMESCYVRATASPPIYDLYPGCNQFEFVKASHEFLSEVFEIAQSGPVDLKVHILPTIYELYNIQLNTTVSDSHILGLDRVTYTDITGTQAHLSYQNPTRFVVKEIQGTYFTTWRFTIIQIIRRAVCAYEHSFNAYVSLPGTQMVTLYPYNSKCRCGVDGHIEYRADIVSTDNNINVGILFSERCASGCHHGNITFTEYNAQYDTLFVHRFTSFPAYMDNIHSNSSLQINLNIETHCKSCPPWIVTTKAHRSSLQKNFQSLSFKRRETESQRIIYPSR